MGKIEDLYIAKAQEWLDLLKKKTRRQSLTGWSRLRAKLLKADPDFVESYEVMYRMLEATEK